MTQGTISKLLEYYFSHPLLFEGELERAHAEFFEREIPTTVDGMALEWFAQWFVYEFQFASGKSVLADFRDRNPLSMSSEELVVYATLERDNEFGFFEIHEVRIDEGILLESLSSGKKFWVKEKMGTHDATAGITIVGRVGKVDDHMEILGNVDVFPLVFDTQTKHALKTERLDPKKYYQSKHERDENPSPYFAPTDVWKDRPEELLRQFAVSLAKCGVLPFVDAEKLVSWINKGTDTLSVIGVVFGLLAEDTSKKDGDELMALLSVCFSLFPKKRTKKSTSSSSMQEDVDEHDATGNTEMHTFGGAEWAEPYDHGLALMRNGDALEAIVEYEKAFTLLIDEKTTTREVYRLFANNGVAHFMIGDVISGNLYIDMALALHPKYEFALMMKERYEHGSVDPLLEFSFRAAHEIRRTDKAAMKKKRAESATSRYFSFIKPFQINFSALPSVSHITTGRHAREKKSLGRNDPCLCGAEKADGTPVKYKHCHGK